jgi:aconitate hydratase
LQLQNRYSGKTLNLKGSEIINILNVEKSLQPREEVTVEFLFEEGSFKKINVLSRIDTDNETEYYKHGGILQCVLRNMT